MDKYTVLWCACCHRFPVEASGAMCEKCLKAGCASSERCQIAVVWIGPEKQSEQTGL